MKVSWGPKTLPAPALVWVIGTYDVAGKPNVMTAAWAGICCSHPPCVAVALRKATYTYGNLVARQAFTVNLPSAEYVREVDYCGLASGRDVDKLARTGLTAVASDLVDAPYVAEFPIVMECKVLQTVEIGSHVQFIGEILDIKIEEAMLGSGGHPVVAKLGAFVLMDGYREVGEHLGQAFAIGKTL